MTSSAPAIRRLAYQLPFQLCQSHPLHQSHQLRRAPHLCPSQQLQQLRKLCCGLVFCMAALPGLAAAQGAQVADTAGSHSRDSNNSNWQENTVPDAPSLRQDALVELPLPSHTRVQLLVDRHSLSVTYPDGVVRYVAVLRGSNTQSALYQGIRCASDEVRTYARYDFNAQPPVWQPVSDDWRAITSMRTPYARAIVRAGACENRVTTTTSEQLRRRFGTQPQWDSH